MQDLFENAKRAASGAVERAAWEADKVRRASARQREADLLQRERVALIEQLSSVILDLEQRGQLTQPPLRAIAERMRTLDKEANAAIADMQAIRGEPFVQGSTTFQMQRRDSTARDSTADDTIPCPTCGRPSRSSAIYCANCGARLK